MIDHAGPNQAKMRRIVQGMHLEPATGKLTPQGAKRLFAVLTQAMAEDEIPADHPEIVLFAARS